MWEAHVARGELERTEMVACINAIIMMMMLMMIGSCVKGKQGF